MIRTAFAALPHASALFAATLVVGLLANPAAARPPVQDVDLENRLLEIARLSEQARKDLEAMALDQPGELPSIILGVGGQTQFRTSPDDAWQVAAAGVELRPGASLRTNVGSWIGVRVGVNATMYIDRLTEVTLSQVELENDTLATRVSVARGLIEFKIDTLESGEGGGWSVRSREQDPAAEAAEEGPELRGLALTNDFSVDLPSSTMAVRGTGFGVRYGGFRGTEVFAARMNRIRAIELQYALTEFRYYLSGGAISSDLHQSPPVASYFETLGPPSLTEDDLPYIDLIYPERLPEIVSPQEPRIENCNPDFPDFTCAAIASVICTVAEDLFNCYEDGLASKLGSGNTSQMSFENRLSNLQARIENKICDDPINDETYDRIIAAVARFCSRQYSGNDIERCNTIFLQEVASFVPPN